MNKVAVIYKSKYGSTEKYARWIAEDAKADLFKAGEIRAEQLDNYDTIVHCGGVYAGGMLGFSFIKKNYDRIRNKKLIVVAVGATLKQEDAIEEVKEHNLTEEMKSHTQVFLLRGGLNYEKMNALDRFLMFLMVKSLKAKKDPNPNADTLGIIGTYGKVVDFTNRKSIEPVVAAINS